MICHYAFVVSILFYSMHAHRMTIIFMPFDGLVHPTHISRNFIDAAPMGCLFLRPAASNQLDAFICHNRFCGDARDASSLSNPIKMHGNITHRTRSIVWFDWPVILWEINNVHRKIGKKGFTAEIDGRIREQQRQNVFRLSPKYRRKILQMLNAMMARLNENVSQFVWVHECGINRKNILLFPKCFEHTQKWKEFPYFSHILSSFPVHSLYLFIWLALPLSSLVYLPFSASTSVAIIITTL